MTTPHKPVTITPKEGGRLATDVSAQEVGLPNYRVKRDWRRYNDREIRREGEDWFWPDRNHGRGDVGTLGQAGQFYGPVTLVHHAKAPSGKIATVVVACCF